MAPKVSHLLENIILGLFQFKFYFVSWIQIFLLLISLDYFEKKNHKFYSFPPHGTLSMLRVSLSGCGWYALDHSDSSFCAHGFVHSLPTCGWWRTCICCVELNLDWPPGGGPLRFDFYLLSFFQYDLVALPREMTLENKGVCHIFF